MVLVYKTTIDSLAKAKRTGATLNRLFPDLNWNFDLEDCDNILRIESDADVTSTLRGLLFDRGIEIEELPD